MNLSRQETNTARLVAQLRVVSAKLLEMLARPGSDGSSRYRPELVRALEALHAETLLTQSAGDTSRGLAPWQMQRVTAYMVQRLDQPLCLTEVSSLLKLSRWHFCTAFRWSSGDTPGNWLQARRMEKACDLLASTSMSITDIALCVGYRSPSAFCSRFRRHTGTTPTRFRRQP